MENNNIVLNNKDLDKKSYFTKYIKYKNKYTLLKKQIGCGVTKMQPIVPIRQITSITQQAIPIIQQATAITHVAPITVDITLTGTIKELLNVSNSIYNYVLSQKSKPITYLICVGQSPAYYALAMMNLPSYDKQNVQIIVLPYSSQINPTNDQELSYIKQLKDNGLNFNMDDEYYFLDQAQSGITFKHFLFMFKRASMSRNNYLLLLNSGGFRYESNYISGINIKEHFISPNLPRFSDTFPRIVMHYKPDMFEIKPMIIGFINMDNPLVKMIIDCAKIYPSKDWYKLTDNSDYLLKQIE